MATPAQTNATNKYIKNHTRRYVMQCNNEKDADIIEYLDSAGNYTQLLKSLIREKMKESVLE